MALRVSRKVWIGGGVVVAAGLAIGTGWLLAGPSGGSESAPTPRVTVTADPAADPSGSTDPHVGDLDGILADEYPDAAPTRTDPNADLAERVHVDYPDALVLEDWVWDRVGEGWSVMAVSAAPTIAETVDEAWTQPPAVAYLVSPDEVYFEIGALPERMWTDARIVSWVEDQDFVRITWGYAEAARYDLRTGAVEDLEFAVYGAPSDSVGFVAANADGAELWRAASANGVKYYRWTATDDWVASALVDETPDMDRLPTFPGIDYSQAVSLDGDTVILTRLVDGEVDGSFVAYTLSTDSVTSFDVPALAGAGALSIQPEDGVIWLSSDDGSGRHGYRTATAEVLEESSAELESEPWDGRVAFGEPTSPAATVFYCGC